MLQHVVGLANNTQHVPNNIYVATAVNLLKCCDSLTKACLQEMFRHLFFYNTLRVEVGLLYQFLKGFIYVASLAYWPDPSCSKDG